MTLPTKLVLAWDSVNVNRNAIPVPSQIGTTPGAASWTDGFPPLCLTPIGSGGIPPSGKDMNGVLWTLSNLLLYWNSGLIAFPYDGTFQTAISGYPIGAKLLQAADNTATWTSNTAANATDPDTGGAGWISSKPLYATTAPTAGAHNDVALPGPSDYVLDVDTTAGAASFSGFVAQRDGQCVVVNNTGANLLTLSALTGSSAANQFRLPTDLALVQNQSATLQYSTGATKWVVA